MFSALEDPPAHTFITSNPTVFYIVDPIVYPPLPGCKGLFDMNHGSTF